MWYPKSLNGIFYRWIAAKRIGERLIYHGFREKVIKFLIKSEPSYKFVHFVKSIETINDDFDQIFEF